MSDSVNPLLDEESVLPSSRSLVNPLMEDDEDENGLPDLDLDFLDAGDFSAPSMVDSTDAENPYPVNYDDYAVMDRYRDEDGSEEGSVGRGSVGDSIEEFLQFSGADYEPDDFSSVDDSFDDSASVEYGEDLSEEVQSDGSLQEDEPSVMGDSLESIIGLTSSVDDSGNVFHDFEDEDEDDEERYYTLKLDEIITRAIDMGASDIDLIANDEVSFSILGNMKRIPEFGILNYRQINNAYEDITTHVNQESFIQELELDTSYEVRSGVYAGRRLRLNVAKSFDTIVLTFRVISNSIPSPDELGIDDRLLKWIDMPNGLVLVNGSTGMGKALRLDTKVPTPSGWTTMGEIKVGDTVYDSSMNECNVEWISNVNNEPDLYKITLFDGQTIIADSDHQWIVSSHRSRNYPNLAKFKKIKARTSKALEDAESIRKLSVDFSEKDYRTVKEVFEFLCFNNLSGELRRIDALYKVFRESNVGYKIINKVRRYSMVDALNSLADSLQRRFVVNDIPLLSTITTQEMIDQGVYVKDNRTNFAIPVVDSAVSNIQDSDLLISPYVLGAWLGDGLKDRGTIVTGEQDFEEALKNLSGKGYDISIRTIEEQSNASYISLDKLKEDLKSLGILNNKHIPYTYLTGSYFQRLELLKGLMDTDGTIYKNGVCEISLSNKKLAENTLSLIRSLGIRSKIRSEKSGYKNKFGEYVDCGLRYRMTFTPNISVFSYDRKNKKVKVGEARKTHKWNYIVSIEKVEKDSSEYGPVLCIGVDSPDHSYLCADYVVTHNSTTLASMIREIQLRHPKKVVTVEKPVEYVYGVSGRGVVHQREVGRDTKSFGAGLDSAMRQHPDVILIGEVRNKEEANALLYAADTGHLAFSTMHTNSAADTLNRIKRMFSGDEQIRVLGDLSESARGFVNQLLIRSPDGKSRFAVREILDISDDDVKDLIRHGNVRGLRDYQMEHEISMEHELTKAVKDGLCTIKDALNASPNRPRMEKLLKQNNIDF